MSSSTLRFCLGKEEAIFFLLLVMILFTRDAPAQRRLSVRLRPGIAFITTEVPEAKMNTGVGFEASVAYRLLPHIAVYGGWVCDSFVARESFAGNDARFEETGYGIGFQFIHPVSENLAFDYFFRGGLIISQIEIENSEGHVIADSGHGGGFQVEAGLCFSLDGPWHLISGIKYQTLSGEMYVDAVNRRIDLNFLSIGVSISRSF